MFVIGVFVPGFNIVPALLWRGCDKINSRRPIYSESHGSCTVMLSSNTRLLLSSTMYVNAPAEGLNAVPVMTFPNLSMPNSPFAVIAP